MEDSSEKLPKPAHRSAARPFFSPRPTSGEEITGPVDARRRRTAHLFTPPGSAPATPAAKRASEPVTLSEMPAIAEPQDEALVVERYAPEEIELTSTADASAGNEPPIEAIAYGEANRMLKAAANAGERPVVDGIQIEATEFSFHEVAVPHTDADSFWATDPFEVAGEPALTTAQALEELKESEPWAVSTAVVDAPEENGVAGALERIAARFRRGELSVAGASEMSDEAALAGALAALLRVPR
jgi:hypothetical protein